MFDGLKSKRQGYSSINFKVVLINCQSQIKLRVVYLLKRYRKIPKVMIQVPAIKNN